MSGPILVFGTVVMDRFRRIERFPRPGQYCEFADERWFLGGEAANTAVALKKWGADVMLLGNSLGDSTESEWLKSQLAEHGLSADYCECAPGPAPTCDIYVDDQGDRTMFGQNWGDGPVELPNVSASWLTVDPNRFDKAKRAVLQAQQAGIAVYAMDFPPTELPLSDRDFWQGSARMFGPRVSMTRISDFIVGLTRRSDATCIVTAGESRITLGRAGQSCQARPYRMEGIVDTTGAGDCFRAGMLFGFWQGWELRRCVAYAAAAAALKCRTEGATSGIPPRSEVESLMERDRRTTAEFASALDTLS